MSKEGSLIRKSVLLLLSKMFNKKIILHAHGGHFFEKFQKHGSFLKKCIIKFINAADILIVLSNKRKKEYSQIINSDKIRVVYNCVAMPLSYKATRKSKHVHIISVGRLGATKGTHDLIEVAYKLRHEKILVEIWGDGEIEKAINEVNRLGIRNIVNIPGWASERDKIRIFHDANIFVLPSYFEDLPLAIIEAMSYKLPIISTCVGGIPELVKSRTNGFLVQPGDIEDLAKKMHILVKNERLRKKMGEASFKLFQDKFECSILEKRMRVIYGELE
jgi:glycosyltransferase involved in cell wall biosynthesis